MMVMTELSGAVRFQNEIRLGVPSGGLAVNYYMVSEGNSVIPKGFTRGTVQL